MTETPSITHRATFYYTLHLGDGDIGTNSNELRQLYTVLAGFFADVSINTANWNGLTTVDRDGQEVIAGWYGTFGVADHVAQKEVEKGKTKGARAYACIGEYGIYKNEKPPITDDLDDDPDEEPEANKCTLDQWGI